DQPTQFVVNALDRLGRLTEYRVRQCKDREFGHPAQIGNGASPHNCHCDRSTRRRIALRSADDLATSTPEPSDPRQCEETDVSEAFVLGWEEWVGLPDLDLPAIKAKVDTGARTSALHAFFVEPFGPPSRRMVRFGVHPIPGRHDVAVICTAEVIDHREVTSSNGESEMRYVIRTQLTLGARTWPIELTLANRETMSYRMLIGRQAIQDDMLVDPATSFHQPRLSYRRYDIPARAAEDRRGL